MVGGLDSATNENVKRKYSLLFDKYNTDENVEETFAKGIYNVFQI